MNNGNKKQKKIMNLNFDFTEDAFFEQTPVQLQQVAELMGFPRDFFKYTLRKLVEYGEMAGVSVKSKRESPKKRLIRKILQWHQKKIYEEIKNIPQKKISPLLSEDNSVIDDMLCILCCSNQRCVVYNDCHHLVCCIICQEKCELKCPLCNTVNKTTQRVYIC